MGDESDQAGPSGEAADSTSGGGLALKLILAGVMVGSMLVLVVVLSRASNSGRKAIEAYMSSVRSGAPVSASVASDEADAVTNALRASTSFSVSNFQAQHDTSCFWITLRGSGKDVAARFVLAERSSTASDVTAVSLTRECECPVDIHLPCRLR